MDSSTQVLIVLDRRYISDVISCINSLPDTVDPVVVTTDPEILNEIRDYRFYRKVSMQLLNYNGQNNGVEVAWDLVKHLGKCSRFISGYDMAMPYVNTLYKNSIREITRVIAGCFHLLAETNAEKLILFGGHPNVEFFATFLAEGERPLQFLYCKAWFLNYYIYHAFRQQFSVDWFKITPRWTLQWAKYLRRAGMLIIRDIMMLLRIIQSTLRSARTDQKAPEDNKKPNMVFLVRKPTQVRSTIELYKEVWKRGEYNPKYLLFNPSSRGGAIRYLDQLGYHYIELNKLLRVGDLFRAHRKSASALINTGTFLAKIGKCEVAISLKEVVLELRTNWIEQILRLIALERYMKSTPQIPVAVFSTEVMDQSAAIEAAWANRYGIPLGTIQHVSLNREQVPRRIWSGLFFATSMKDRELVRDSFEAPFTVCIGPASLDRIYAKKVKNRPLRVIGFFDQPDDFAEASRDVAQRLTRLCREINIDLVIKPHPRSRNVGYYKKIVRQYGHGCVLSPNTDSGEVVKDLNIVVSFISTTLFEAVISGVPCVSWRNENNDNKYHGAWFLEDGIVHHVSNEEDIREICRDYDAFLDRFAASREEFLRGSLNRYQGDGVKKWYDEVCRWLSGKESKKKGDRKI